MELFSEDKLEKIEGKVDWKGRQALEHKHRGLKTSILVIATFGLENMATTSLAVNLVTYFSKAMHFDVADAANVLTNYMGTSYIITILLAVLADTYLGRLKVVVVSGVLEFMGLALLTMQSHYPSLKPPLCDIFDPNAHCEKINGYQAALLFVSLYLLAIGSGGIKAALPALGADQYDETDPKEANQMSSFFNFLLLASCVAAVISFTLFVWIQDKRGWDWGFGMSSVSIFLAVIIFIAGIPMYRTQIVQGSSAIFEIFQVFVASIRNQKLKLPEDPLKLYEIYKDNEAARELEFLPHRDIFRFLDKAAIQETQSTGESQAPNPWKLCRVTQVENAKIVLGMVPIFCCTTIMTLCLAQLQTFSIQQGLTMDTNITKHFDIPPASLPSIPIIFMIIMIPIYDRIFVPFVRKFTGRPTGISHLQRIGVGLILSSLSMATASIIEVKRKRVAREHGMLDANPVMQQLPISAFWLAFQFFIFGIADMFTYVGLLEFFYSEAPKALKSISTCFLWSSMAIGYFFSTMIVKIINSATKGITRSGGWLAGNNINRNHLNLFYLLLSLLSLANFCVYLFVAKRYKYRSQKPVGSS